MPGSSFYLYAKYRHEITSRERRYKEKKSDVMRAHAVGFFLNHIFAMRGSVNQSRARSKMAIHVWIRNHGVVQLQVSQEKPKAVNVK